MHEQEDVSLSNLAGGGVVERFDDELKNILANILDPNTTLAAREITLKVKIKPDKNRDFGSIDVEVKSKLAPAMPIGTKVFIAVTPSGAVATEYNPAQQSLPLDMKPGTVTPLRAVGGK
jgi:hypothetical protein